MKSIEYIFKDDSVVHVLQTKPSANSKLGLGYIVTTYHFSVGQVISTNLTDDADVCFDCPFSFNQNNGKSGKCYTHKGLMRMGINSMLKRLQALYLAGKVKDFSEEEFKAYATMSKRFSPVLTRMGGYGEPITLPLEVVAKLTSLSKKHAGYTHQWHREDMKQYRLYLMASTHNTIETRVANGIGWRAFFSKPKGQTEKGAVCPAAIEFTGNKKTCIECGTCNGTIDGKKNNILINIH
jgi:hypothetical protein